MVTGIAIRNSLNIVPMERDLGYGGSLRIRRSQSGMCEKYAEFHDSAHRGPNDNRDTFHQPTAGTINDGRHKQCECNPNCRTARPPMSEAKGGSRNLRQKNRNPFGGTLVGHCVSTRIARSLARARGHRASRQIRPRST